MGDHTPLLTQRRGLLRLLVFPLGSGLFGAPAFTGSCPWRPGPVSVGAACLLPLTVLPPRGCCLGKGWSPRGDGRCRPAARSTRRWSAWRPPEVSARRRQGPRAQPRGCIYSVLAMSELGHVKRVPVRLDCLEFPSFSEQESTPNNGRTEGRPCVGPRPLGPRASAATPRPRPGCARRFSLLSLGPDFIFTQDLT